MSSPSADHASSSPAAGAEPAGSATLQRIVTASDTAAAYGEPFPPAAATPFVLGLAEIACHNAIADRLEPGEITVGVGAEVQHTAPTPIGWTLTAVADVTAQDGRRYKFRVVVSDNAGECAVVRHERAVVRADSLLARMDARSAKGAS